MTLSPRYFVIIIIVKILFYHSYCITSTWVFNEKEFKLGVGMWFRIFAWIFFSVTIFGQSNCWKKFDDVRWMYDWPFDIWIEKKMRIWGQKNPRKKKRFLDARWSHIICISLDDIYCHNQSSDAPSQKNVKEWERWPKQREKNVNKIWWQLKQFDFQWRSMRSLRFMAWRWFTRLSHAHAVLSF